jgi:hypothetical protein
MVVPRAHTEINKEINKLNTSTPQTRARLMTISSNLTKLWKFQHKRRIIIVRIHNIDEIVVFISS